MSPFDLKTVLLAKHAQHVVLIHFPIALFMMGAAFDLAAQRTKNPLTAGVARYNLVAAALFVPLVLLTGILAWQWALGAPRLKGILLLHLVVSCLASVVIVSVGWLHFRAGRRPDASLPKVRLPLELFGVALIGLAAHL